MYCIVAESRQASDSDTLTCLSFWYCLGIGQILLVKTTAASVFDKLHGFASADQLLGCGPQLYHRQGSGFKGVLHP